MKTVIQLNQSDIIDVLADKFSTDSNKVSLKVTTTFDPTFGELNIIIAEVEINHENRS